MKFNDFHLVCKYKKLITQCVKIFRKHNSSLDKNILKNMITEIFSHYNNENYFHNARHVFEVFSMTDMFMTYSNLITINNKILLLFTAICHDISHIGINNKELEKIVNNNDTLSLDLIRNKTYSNILRTKSWSYDNINDIKSMKSYNEYVHIEDSLVILKRYETFLFQDPKDMNLIYETHNSLILTTDIKLHQRYMNIIQYKNTEISDMIHILKMADISHPLQSFGIHLYWVFNLMNEEDNCIKYSTLSVIANDTIFFITIFLKPLVELFQNKYPLSSKLFKNLENNICIWKRYHVK